MTDTDFSSGGERTGGLGLGPGLGGASGLGHIEEHYEYPGDGYQSRGRPVPFPEPFQGCYGGAERISRDGRNSIHGSFKGSPLGSRVGSRHGSRHDSNRSSKGSPSPPWPAYVDSDEEGNIHVSRARPRSRKGSYSPRMSRPHSLTYGSRRSPVYVPSAYPPARSGHGHSGTYDHGSGQYDYDARVSRRTAVQRAQHTGSGSDEGTNLSDDAYSFTLSRHKRVNSTLDTSLNDVMTDVEGETKESNGAPPSADGNEKAAPAKKVNHKMTIRNIFQAKYTGEGSIDGVQSADITILPTSPQTAAAKKARPPLFRWVHFQDEAMNFDGLQSGVDNIPGLSDLERQAISRLLTRARKRFDKPFQTSAGQKARFFMPCLISEAVASQAQSKASKPRVATWICQPHFQLGKYKTATVGTGKPADHPVRTLMQARFALVQKERDMQQAVCQLKDAKLEICFHIVQTWYLVLDESLLVTCSGLRMQDLEGESIKAMTQPLSTMFNIWPPQIAVQCGRCLLWSFRVDECQSWFDFVTHFGEFWPRKVEFRHNGKLVGVSDWPKILGLAAKATVNLTMEHKAPSRDKFEAPDDFPRVDYDPEHEDELQKEKLAEKERKRAGKSALPPTGLVPHDESGKPVKATEPSKPDFDGLSVPTFMPTPPKRSYTFSPDLAATPPSRTNTGGLTNTKPINLADGFYVFTWLNAHPTSMQSPPIIQKPAEPQRSTSRGRMSSSAGFDFVPIPRPEMQWAVDEKEVRSDLKEVDDFLNSKSTVSDCVMYRETPNISRKEVFDALVKKKQKMLDATEKNDQEKLKVMENKATILAAADQAFQFFLPSKFEGPTVEKYWGAIYQLLFPDRYETANDSYNPPYYTAGRYGSKRNYGVRERDLYNIIDFLGTVVKQCQPFKELFSGAHSTDRLNLKLPEEFAKAWLYILICMAASTKDIMVFDTEINHVYDLMAKGMRKVVEGNAKKSLLESLVFTPFELATLINFQLVEGTNKHSDDIIEPYWQYLRSLEADIASNPLDRGHQDRIALFQQEVEVASETLQQQKRILMLASPSANSKTSNQYGRAIGPLGIAYNEDLAYAGQANRGRAPNPYGMSSGLHDYDMAGLGEEVKYKPDKALKGDYTQQHYADFGPDIPVIVSNSQSNPGSQLQPTHPSGVLGILIYDSLSIVDHKLRDLKEMNEWLEHLSNSSLQKIDTNKDRQEAAIFAFTIVTIIFLPLSTVASIMGMNTSDIRDMDYEQWVFWVTAVPLFVIIVILCLLWAGELGNFWIGFAGLWRKGNRARKGVGQRVTHTISQNRQYPGENLGLGTPMAATRVAPGGGMVAIERPTGYGELMAIRFMRRYTVEIAGKRYLRFRQPSDEYINWLIWGL